MFLQFPVPAEDLSRVSTKAVKELDEDDVTAAMKNELDHATVLV